MSSVCIDYISFANELRAWKGPFRQKNRVYTLQQEEAREPFVSYGRSPCVKAEREVKTMQKGQTYRCVCVCLCVEGGVGRMFLFH